MSFDRDPDRYYDPVDHTPSAVHAAVSIDDEYEPPSLPSPPPSYHAGAKKPTRVIMHVDFDCFYAQVESHRFPHLRYRPLGVVQNGTLCVTTNYRARARGLPKTAAPGPMAVVCPEAAFVGSDMKRYRAASRQWLSIFATTGAVVNKRGIDEAYLDLTAVVRERIRQGHLRRARRHRHPEQIAKRLEEQFAVAEAVWRRENADMRAVFGHIDDNLLESSGTLIAAQRASASTDPITKLRQQQRMQNEGKMVEEILSNKPIVLDPTMAAMTPEERETYCNALHPIDYCRARRGQTVPIELVDAAVHGDDDDNDDRNDADVTLTWNPWIGEVIYAGERPTVSAVARDTDGDDDSQTPLSMTDDSQPDDTEQQSATKTAALLTDSQPPIDFSHEDPLNPSDDYLMCVGSQIAFEIRSQLFAEMGMTTSAGIAPNMMLAKIASSMNKPNQQSIVRRSIAIRFISTHPLSRVSGFGPKAQECAEEAGLTMISQVQQRSHKSLISEFGDAFGDWLYNIGRAEDDTRCEQTAAPKSIGQSKRQRTSNESERLELLYWLASNLYKRMEEDEYEYNRRASVLILSWIPATNTTWASLSRRVPLPYLRDHVDPVQTMYEMGIALLREHLPDMTRPLRCLSLGVSNFVKLPSAKSIESYFNAPSLSKTDAVKLEPLTFDGTPQLSADDSSSSSAPALQMNSNQLALSAPSFTDKFHAMTAKVRGKKNSILTLFNKQKVTPPTTSVSTKFMSLVTTKKAMTQSSTASKSHSPSRVTPSPLIVTNEPIKRAEADIIDDDIAQVFDVADNQQSTAQTSAAAASKPSLLSLLQATATPASSSSSSLSFICSKCSASIPLTDETIHADYHYAAELQAQVRAIDRQNRQITNAAIVTNSPALVQHNNKSNQKRSRVDAKTSETTLDHFMKAARKK